MARRSLPRLISPLLIRGQSSYSWIHQNLVSRVRRARRSTSMRRSVRLECSVLHTHICRITVHLVPLLAYTHEPRHCSNSSGAELHRAERIGCCSASCEVARVARQTCARLCGIVRGCNGGSTAGTPGSLKDSLHSSVIGCSQARRFRIVSCK